MHRDVFNGNANDGVRNTEEKQGPGTGALLWACPLPPPWECTSLIHSINSPLAWLKKKKKEKQKVYFKVI